MRKQDSRRVGPSNLPIDHGPCDNDIGPCVRQLLPVRRPETFPQVVTSVLGKCRYHPFGPTLLLVEAIHDALQYEST